MSALNSLLLEHALLLLLIVGTIGVLILATKVIRPWVLIAGVLILSTVLITFEPKGIVPVVGATKKDWHPKSFWYEPWGRSIVHRGVDIFAERGRPVVSTTDCIVLMAEEIEVGGRVVLCLDRSLRFHYFAHLDNIKVTQYTYISQGDHIGTVGDSGNAKGKPPHLHYGVMSAIPRPWAATSETLGWMKMLYINPTTLWEYD